MTLVGVGLGVASLVEMRDFPHRVQYFRIGLFALPQLAQVLMETIILGLTLVAYTT